MKAFLSTLWADEAGQDLTEYVLLLVIIALGVTAAVVAFRTQLSASFGAATTELTNQTP